MWHGNVKFCIAAASLRPSWERAGESLFSEHLCVCGQFV